MNLRGLPDLGSPRGESAYEAFQLPDSVALLPDGLALALDPDGFPMIRLERYRGVDPTKPPKPYGLLTVWLALTSRDPPHIEGRSLSVSRALPDRGVLRVGLRVMRDELIPTTPVPWDAAMTVAWGTWVSAETAEVIHHALTERFLPLEATAEMEVRAVAPRLGVVIEVRVPALLGALTDLCDEAGLIIRGQLVSWLHTEVLTAGVSTGPVNVVHGQAPAEELAEVIADWIRARHGRAATQLGERAVPGAVAINQDAAGPDIARWDLSTAQLAHRPITLSQDISLQLRGLGNDLARFVPEGRTVPTIDLGWAQVDVLANIPDRQVGVLASGVNLTAPPHPPARHQAATASCEFTSDSTRALATLRLSPGEQLRYVSQAWMVIQDQSGVREVQGPQHEHTGRRLILVPSDFGVRVLPVSVDDALLDLASVAVRLLVAGQVAGSVELDRGHRDAAFVLDRDPTAPDRGDGPDPGLASPDQTDAQLVVALRSRVDGREVLLDAIPAAPTWLAPATIPGWGPHEVTIDARDCPDPLTALELRAELTTDDDATVISLSPEQPIRTWRYFAADPLHPGFFYRRRLPGHNGQWRGPRAADAPLVLGGGT